MQRDETFSIFIPAIRMLDRSLISSGFLGGYKMARAFRLDGNIGRLYGISIRGCRRVSAGKIGCLTRAHPYRK
jgi:hypothetical protein